MKTVVAEKSQIPGRSSLGIKDLSECYTTKKYLLLFLKDTMKFSYIQPVLLIIHVHKIYRINHIRI